MTPKQFVIAHYPEALALRKKQANGKQLWTIHLNLRDKPVATANTRKEAWQIAEAKIAPSVLTKALDDSLKQKTRRSVNVGSHRK